MNIAYAKGLNIVHGTTATAAAVENLYKNLKKKGYKITLLLCDAMDENRAASIRNRENTQGFYQVTPEDAVQKSKAFYDRFPIYFAYADEMYFYWTDDYKEGSIKAAHLKKGGALEIVNEKAFDAFKARYEMVRLQNPSYPDFDVMVRGYSKFIK